MIKPSQKWIKMERDKMRQIEADHFDADSLRVVVKNLTAILAILSHHVNYYIKKLILIICASGC
jgi:hypothetical protein